MDKSPPQPIQQRPRPGATRCPYCHDECPPGAEVCACAECLSRHHTACWDESGSCASCRSTARLDPGQPAPKSSADYEGVIGAWVKLCLAYNGVLTLTTLAAFGAELTTFRGLATAGFGAVLANFCFLLGPAFELILRFLGVRRTETLRWTLFFLGTSLAALLAAASAGMP